MKKGIQMSLSKSSQIAIRVSKFEKERFFLLASLENKTLTQLFIDYVDNELKNRKMTQSELRKLPKEIRAAYLQKLSEQAIPVYQKYKEELEVEETGDGIE